MAAYKIQMFVALKDISILGISWTTLSNVMVLTRAVLILKGSDRQRWELQWRCHRPNHPTNSDFQRGG